MQPARHGVSAEPERRGVPVVAISDETGRLFGMMPHPEAYLYAVNHPRWTREKVPEEGMGLAIFRNAVEYIRKNL